MRRNSTVLVFVLLFTALSWGQSDEPNFIEVVGVLQYPVFRIGGETTGIEISIPRRNSYELEFPDLQTLEQAKKLDGQLVKVKGSVRLVPGVEREDREIITVNELVTYLQTLYCIGTQLSGRFYESGSIATVQKGKSLLGLLQCDIQTETQLVNCRDKRIVDAGYELNQIDAQTYDVYEHSFFGRKKVDTFVCD